MPRATSEDRSMHLIARAAFVGLLFACATAEAQVQEEIRRCASISVDAERLACYDRLFRGAASSSAAAGPAATAPAGAAAGGAAGAGAARSAGGAAPAGAAAPGSAAGGAAPAG